MDPTSCLHMILELIADFGPISSGEGREDLVEALGNLRRWVNKGGGLPKVTQIDGETFTVKSRS